MTNEQLRGKANVPSLNQIALNTQGMERDVGGFVFKLIFTSDMSNCPSICTF